MTSPANSWKGERKPRLSYKEKMEKEQLEKDIAALEEEKKAIEARLCSGTLPSDQLTSDSVRIGEVTRAPLAGTRRDRVAAGRRLLEAAVRCIKESV